MSAVLVGVDELRELLSGSRVRLLDVRWALDDPDGPEHYLAGHIPGAVFVDLETELAAPPSPAAGRHPLPKIAVLERCARSWGVCEGDPVVVYDAAGGTAAARAWWLLRWAGIADVRLLDGGLPAWTAAGHELAIGAECDPVPGDVRLTGGALPVIDARAAARWHGTLLDARSADRFRGDVETHAPRAGHIPGAICAPAHENLDDAGRFRDPAWLRDRFSGLGAGPVAVYCGSGVTAAHQIAALAVAGIDAALYPGSWSQWSHDARRPVATGG